MTTQDFSDSGALYQNHLHRVKHILKQSKYRSKDISELGIPHNISSILAQNAAEERATRQESPTSDKQHISRSARTEHAEPAERIVTGTTAVGRGRKAAGKKHAGNRKGKVKASLHRTHKMKLRKDTILPSKDSGGEIGGSAQKQRE